MDNQIKSWMYNIIIFLIFSSLLLQVASGKKYEKYISFFSGIIVIILVISPVLNVVGSENKMNFNYLEECFFQAAQLASQESENINSIKEKTFSKTYSMQIQLSLEKILNSKGYELINAQIDLEDDSNNSNYYYPKYIKATISADLNDKKLDVEPVSIDISVSKNSKNINKAQYDEKILALRSDIAEFFSMEEGAVILEIVN